MSRWQQNSWRTLEEISKEFYSHLVSSLGILRDSWRIPYSLFKWSAKMVRLLILFVDNQGFLLILFFEQLLIWPTRFIYFRNYHQIWDPWVFNDLTFFFYTNRQILIEMVTFAFVGVMCLVKRIFVFHFLFDKNSYSISSWLLLILKTLPSMS